MSHAVHIFISYDAADTRSALDLQRQIGLALQPRDTVFWNRELVPPEAFRAQALAFLEHTDLFVAILSMNYEDTPDVRWEMSTVLDLQDNRPNLQVLTVLARESVAPTLLRTCQTALPTPESIEKLPAYRDQQLRRAAESAVAILEAAPLANRIPIGDIVLPFSIEALRERLLAQTDRINHTPLLSLLKRIIKDVPVKRAILDIEDAYRQLREQTRLSQVTIQALQQQSKPILQDLQYLLERLEEPQLVPAWRSVFIRDYYHFTPESRDESSVPPFFVPTDEIYIPESLHRQTNGYEQTTAEAFESLSFEQQNEFRRSLLLAKDALAVNNPAQAYAHCDHARQKIDPQSAQLYEYLMMTFIQKETPSRIMGEASKGNDRLLQHVLLFASRLREHQNTGKCPSSTALHNLAVAAESLSDAALRTYFHLPNDPIRDTGKHAEAVPDHRPLIRSLLGYTLQVCQLVYPAEELLEAAVIENCGGGKCHWVKRVEVVDQNFQFISEGHLDVIGEIQELLAMLQGMESNDPNKIVKGRVLLREDLYFSLLAKRQTLHTQLLEDAKRMRPYTDVRSSIIRFTHACLLGAHVFGDEDALGKGHSFLRLALEYLLPGLLNTPAVVEAASIPWFTLDENGRATAHPDCAGYHFDVAGIVEKIVLDLAGPAGWSHVAPNIQERIYLQYVADTAVLYEKVRTGLTPTDIRKMDIMDARRLLIACIHRWVVAFKADPVRGVPLLENGIREMIGDGLLIWLQHDPYSLVAHPDSLAQGFDAPVALKKIHDLLLSAQPNANTAHETFLSGRIATNLFEKRILPTYHACRKGDESQRANIALLLLETLRNYQLHPDINYLHFVWQELTEEIKLPWIDVGTDGQAVDFKPVKGFDPTVVVREINTTDPTVFRLLDVRTRIADLRHADQVRRYFREISEFTNENRQTERQIAIEIIQKTKCIFRYYPKAAYLQLAWDELHGKPGKHRIRWNTRFLGIVPTNNDHYENQFLNFNYKYERFELRRLLDNQFNEMQRVLSSLS
jgi:hypothetical protein